MGEKNANIFMYKRRDRCLMDWDITLQHIYQYIFNIYIYIFKYIYRERERLIHTLCRKKRK